MCEILERWWKEGEESKAHQISINLFRMGMLVENSRSGADECGSGTAVAQRGGCTEVSRVYLRKTKD